MILKFNLSYLSLRNLHTYKSSRIFVHGVVLYDRVLKTKINFEITTTFLNYERGSSSAVYSKSNKNNYKTFFY